MFSKNGYCDIGGMLPDVFFYGLMSLTKCTI